MNNVTLDSSAAVPSRAREAVAVHRSGDRPVAVVTGTSSGIGNHIARQLAARGWSLVLVNRDPSRTAQLVEDLGPSVAASITADLADHRSITAAAEAISRSIPAIDLLVNNAGILFAKKQRSRQGIEMHFEVQALAPYQLIRRLDGLLRPNTGTVICVGSGLMYPARRLKIDELVDPSDTRKLFGPYAQSKLAVATICTALAPIYAERGIVLRVADPGGCRTPMTAGQGMPVFMRPIRQLLFRSPAYGAARVVSAAFDARFERKTGVCISGRKIKRAPVDALDPSLQQRLLALCRELTSV